MAEFVPVLEDKTVIITGAAMSMGETTARVLLKRK